MAHRVGTAAHAALAAAQAMKVREGNPDAWTRTARLALASASLATLLLGKWVALSGAEVAGTGMWNAQLGRWDEITLEIVAGSKEGGRRLKDMLGPVEPDAGRRLGSIASYFVERYGFDPGSYLTSSSVFISSRGHRDVYYSLHVRPSRDVSIIMPNFFRFYHFLWIHRRPPHLGLALPPRQTLQPLPSPRTGPFRDAALRCHAVQPVRAVRSIANVADPSAATPTYPARLCEICIPKPGAHLTVSSLSCPRVVP